MLDHCLPPSNRAMASFRSLKKVLNVQIHDGSLCSMLNTIVHFERLE